MILNHGPKYKNESISHLSAKKLLSDLKEVHGNDLLFHQSGGCCDGSAPMCFPAKEYMVGDSDVKLGEIDGTPFILMKNNMKNGNIQILQLTR